MKMLSLFSGIGAFEKALKNIGIEFELVGFSEVDKYAVKSYCAIHGVPEAMNLGDITKIDETTLPEVDLITYGFPCQDISIAGKQKGLITEKGLKTRSGLFFDALRIIEATKPKIAIAENVKNLVGKKFNAQFQVVLASLESAGYNNYFKVLNAKDYGVPQNRERVFIVSIRKDIDHGLFSFPEPFPLLLRLKDILEPQVLRQVRTEYGKQIRKAYESGGSDEKWGNMKRFEPREDGISNTLSTVQKDNLVAEPTLARCVGGIGEKKSNGGQQYYQQDRVYQGDIALAHPASIPGGSYRYLVEEPLALDEQNQYIRKDGCVGTIMTDGSSPKKNNRIIQSDLRIRKLTPKECFRLMGFDDESFHRAEAINSNSQLYKQAGNSIVVDVLEAIFSMMFAEEGHLSV